jgi:hypothetical protein
MLESVPRQDVSPEGIDEPGRIEYRGFREKRPTYRYRYRIHCVLPSIFFRQAQAAG